MSMNNFPPQAYTRDTLSAAYEWLRDQPGSIRELAQDSDSLVSLFLQSRRRASGANQTSPNAMPPAPQVSAPQSSAVQNQNLASAESFKEDLKVLAQGLKQFETPKVRVEIPRTPEQKPIENSLSVSLDQKSLSLINEVQKRLNLSTPSEAVRMMIALGYDRAREILPKN